MGVCEAGTPKALDIGIFNDTHITHSIYETGKSLLSETFSRFSHKEY